MFEDFKILLRDIPISINNLADPVILRDSTAKKLDVLVEDRHTGPVALITKGSINNAWWRERLAYWSRHLNLFVFVSISELGLEWEKAASSEQRYRNLQTARDAGAYAIAYIRPIIHGVNDSVETISRMFEQSYLHGAHAIVSSGFRGDQQTIESAGMQDLPAPDGQDWMKTLKLTPQITAEFMVEKAATIGIPYWTRTSCCVAALMGQRRSINPYYVAPKFVGCERCPLSDTCSKQAQFMQPREHSLEFLRYLGYRIESHTATARYERCGVEVRSQCTLCCTNCPRTPDMGAPYVNLRRHDGSMPSWGDMSLARFLTGGMLVTDPGIPPGENSNVTLHPRFKMPDGRFGVGGLYGVNSWMVWSEYLPAGKCFKCRYCFLGMFKDNLPEELQVTVGMSPSRLLGYETRRVHLPLAMRSRMEEAWTAC